MNETEIVTVGRALPRLRTVEPGNGPYGVRVTWADGPRAGQVDSIDLAPIVLTFKVFRPLRDDAALFRTVRLGEWGASIVWDGSADLDIGADSLEDLIAETMTNADFAEFMKRHRLSLDATAAHLGISRRMAAYYAKERDVPRYIALACRYLDLSLSGTTDSIPAAA